LLALLASRKAEIISEYFDAIERALDRH
jgi:hypothetical protein